MRETSAATTRVRKAPLEPVKPIAVRTSTYPAHRTALARGLRQANMSSNETTR